ncbi:MAG TPA: helix-turn-helix transcriptional regulator [Acholeplasmataceae bacterium]|nr:helix-turn-helix transcriptional regulator [Acholeplasmataceae bacterium]
MLNYDLKLKEVRKKKGLSQQKLASLLNTRQQNISEYENQVVSPNLERLVEIAQILEVSLDELVIIKDIHAQYSKEMAKKNKK